MTPAQEEFLRGCVRHGHVTGVHPAPPWQELCARMCEAGLLRRRGLWHGTPLYDVTADGFDAVAE